MISRAGSPVESPQVLKLEDRRRDNEAFLVAWKAVFEYAQIAIRAILLANGAAATGILTFLGANNEIRSTRIMLGFAVCVFAFGVVGAVIACFMAYLNQYSVIRSAVENDGVVRVGGSSLRIYAIASAFFGLGCFLVGIVLATVAHSS